MPLETKVVIGIDNGGYAQGSSDSTIQNVTTLRYASGRKPSEILRHDILYTIEVQFPRGNVLDKYNRQAARKGNHVEVGEYSLFNSGQAPSC